MSRYGPAGGDDEFEPGSDCQVLRNRLGVTELRIIGLIESRQLAWAQDEFYEAFSADHRFTVGDLRQMHRHWLGDVYPFAGELREVDIGKGGFQFAKRSISRIKSRSI